MARSFAGALVAVVVLLLGPAWAAAAGGGVFGLPIDSGAVGTEVPALRTEFSDTFVRSDGAYVARISPVAVNAPDGRGGYRPIDTTLKRGADGSLRPGAAAAPVELPARLSEPVRVSDGGRSVSLQLAGAAAAAATVDDSTATYREVLPGVDAVYEVLGSGVKETLVVRSHDVTARLAYTLKLSPGLSARVADDGSARIVDGAGVVRFWLPAPTVQAADQAQPSTDHVRFELSGDGATLTVAVDSDWLANAALPVRIDPTTVNGGTTSCTIASGDMSAVSACNGDELKVGRDSAGHVYRSVFWFDGVNEAVPTDAQIMSAQLKLTQRSEPWPDDPKILLAQGLSTQPGVGATWQNAAAGQAWSSPGGDLQPDPQPSEREVQGCLNGWFCTFEISRLVEGWVRRPQSNTGMIVRAAEESAAGVHSFGGKTYIGFLNGPPYVQVVYRPQQPGVADDQTFEQRKLSDTSRIDINVATGNPVITNDDVTLPGNGIDLKLSRSYNAPENGIGSIGTGWNTELNGYGLRGFYEDTSGAITLLAHGGAIYRFDRDYAHDTTATQAYLSPDNLNATLIYDTSTTHATLVDHDTGLSYRYEIYLDECCQSPGGGNGRLYEIADTAGHAITVTYKGPTSEHPATITDTTGQQLTFTWTWDDLLQKISYPDGRVWNYTVQNTGGHQLLTSYTDPDNNTTTYTYNTDGPDAWEQLTQIQGPGSNTTTLTWGGDEQAYKLVQLAVSTDPDDTGTPWTYYYDPDETDQDLTCPATVDNPADGDGQTYKATTAIDQHGLVATYCVNRNNHVIKTLYNDTVAPTLTADGSFLDLNGNYIKGDQPYSVDLAATDPQPASGVRNITLKEGAGALATVKGTCTPPSRPTRPTRCAATATGTATVQTTPLGEGEHQVEIGSTDLAGNFAPKALTTFAIDRTAPPPAAFFSNDQDENDDGTLVVYWANADDAALPDGTRGSGLAQWAFRYRLGGSSAWSAWTMHPNPSAPIPVASFASTYEVQVITYDAVGNASPTTTSMVTYVDPETWSAVLPEGLAVDESEDGTDEGTSPSLRPPPEPPIQGCRGKSTKDKTVFSVDTTGTPGIRYGYRLQKAYQNALMDGWPNLRLVAKASVYINGSTLSQGGPNKPAVLPNYLLHGALMTYAKAGRSKRTPLQVGDIVEIKASFRGTAVSPTPPYARVTVSLSAHTTCEIRQHDVDLARGR